MKESGRAKEGGKAVAGNGRRKETRKYDEGEEDGLDEDGREGGGG